MLTQLHPPLPMKTSRGDGWAHAVIDYGIESHLYWVVFLTESGECWTLPNPEIRMDTNPTLGRYTTSPIEIAT